MKMNSQQSLMRIFVIRRLRKQNRAIKEDSNSPLKRTAIIVFLVILVVITLIVMMTRVGRISANSDPLLDPMANPHIRIEDD